MAAHRYAHQAKLAAAIHQGVHDCFYANPPQRTAYCASLPPTPILRKAGALRHLAASRNWPEQCGPVTALLELQDSPPLNP